MKDYKKILEGVVNIINTTEKSDIGFANICAYIGDNCPELKESEDEKIRKELLNYLYDVHDDDEERARWIAWLEKQGEHANFLSKIQVGDKVTRNEDGVLVNLSQLNRVAKPADKVEPKFKVGDWVVTKDGKVNQVKTVSDDGDAYDLDDDTYFSGSWKDMYHLWTIQDAKAGDVLANNGNIILFKQISDSARPDYKFIQSYCFVLTHRFDFYLSGTYSLDDGFHPAIKEQRDTLMKAMTDAGYTFDFEKKELKKIEQNPVEPQQDMLSQEQYAKAVDECVFGEQKPAWSEEDEARFKSCIKILQTSDRYDTINTKWLKFLKGRYTWKPSDEQINALDEVYKTHGANNVCRRILFNLMNDLKKLREE